MTGKTYREWEEFYKTVDDIFYVVAKTAKGVDRSYTVSSIAWEAEKTRIREEHEKNGKVVEPLTEDPKSIKIYEIAEDGKMQWRSFLLKNVVEWGLMLD